MTPQVIAHEPDFSFRLYSVGGLLGGRVNIPIETRIQKPLTYPPKVQSKVLQLSSSTS